MPPPSLEDVQSAHTDLKKILHPKCPNGIGYKNPEINPTLATRFQAMQLFMWRFINPDSQEFNSWEAASKSTAADMEHGDYQACKLQEWTGAFISNRENLPTNKNGHFRLTLIDKDESLAQELHLHLQSIGKYVKVEDIVNFLDSDEIRHQTGIKK